MACRAVWVIVALTAVAANMYDVVEPAMTPPAECPLGCAPWADVAAAHNTAPQRAVDALWASAAAQAAAGASCAMPANFAGAPGAGAVGAAFDFSFGPQCFCAGTAAAPSAASGYCGDPATPTPQQVNLVFGATEADLAVAFTTVDGGAPLAAPPLVELCAPRGGACVNATGATERAAEPQRATRVLSFHFVPLPSLPRGEAGWTYRVRGGTARGAWSARFELRPRPAPRARTRFALAGDLGIYSYAALGNLAADSDLSAYVHLGDHAYNMEMGGGARGDAYMMGLQRVLSTMPMVAVYGNHELEGSPFGAYCPRAEHCETRFTNQTAGQRVTGAASGSHSQLYFSINIGLVHLVVLDSMFFIGLESDEPVAQLAWLAADLTAAAAPAARAAVPWIVVCTHVPMYAGDGNNDGLIKSVEPLLFAHGVDVFAVGHNHFYESEWPTGPAGAIAARSFQFPRAPVHVVSGAGGAPAFGAEGPPLGARAAGGAPPAFVRKNIYRWSYSVLETANATHLTWSQFDNENSTVLDSWTIETTAAHGFGGC